MPIGEENKKSKDEKTELLCQHDGHGRNSPILLGTHLLGAFTAATSNTRDKIDFFNG